MMISIPPLLLNFKSKSLQVLDIDADNIDANVRMKRRGLPLTHQLLFPDSCTVTWSRLVFHRYNPVEKLHQ
jgi:hypothetical protein